MAKYGDSELCESHVMREREEKEHEVVQSIGDQV